MIVSLILLRLTLLLHILPALLGLVVVPYVLSAQNEGNNWVFGYDKKITFLPDSSIVVDTNYRLPGKNANWTFDHEFRFDGVDISTISDKNGNLLFTTYPLRGDTTRRSMDSMPVFFVDSNLDKYTTLEGVTGTHNSNRSIVIYPSAVDSIFNIIAFRLNITNYWATQNYEKSSYTWHYVVQYNRGEGKFKLLSRKILFMGGMGLNQLVKGHDNSYWWLLIHGGQGTNQFHVFELRDTSSRWSHTQETGEKTIVEPHGELGHIGIKSHFSRLGDRYFYSTYGGIAEVYDFNRCSGRLSLLNNSLSQPQSFYQIQWGGGFHPMVVFCI